MRDRIRAAFAEAGHSLDEDILEELAQHAESAYESSRADGNSESDAVAVVDALIRGWVEHPQDLRRATRRAAAVVPPPESRRFAAGALADAVYAWRLLKSRPGHAVVTILTIALGIGAVTTLFSVANGVLLRPLSWATDEGVVRVSETRGGRPGRIPGTLMNGSYLSWAEQPQTISSIGAYTDGTLTLTGTGDAVRVTTTNVTPSLFEVLGAQPLRGSLFTSNHGRNGSWRFVILSQGVWEQRFGAREDLIGQTIVLDGMPCTVVGILPRSFQFPTSATQMWLPLGVSPVEGENGVKRGQIFRALARLKPGVTATQAAAEATARAVAAPDAGPVSMALFGASQPIQIAVTDAKAAATADVRPAIIILLMASILLFASAIGNVANMQVARAAGRQRELTIRAALGAGMGRLSRQLLIENAMIGIAGAAIGLALSIALHRVMPALLPANFPRVDAITIDGRVLAFTVGLSLLASLAAGVLPVMHARRLDLARALSEGSLASAGAGRSRMATMRLLIAGSQIAVTSVLVIGGVLLTRSFLAHMAADRGYDPTNVLTATVPFPGGYTFEQRQQARSQIIERLAARPGITHAAFSTGVPLMSAGGYSTFTMTSPFGNGSQVQAEAIRRVVTPGYFGALGVRIRAGRPITDADVAGSTTSVVVNRSFVRKYLNDVPIERAVGVSLGARAVSGASFTGDVVIVGVADDLRQDLVDAPDQSEMFVAMAQVTAAASQGSTAILVLRTEDDPVSYVETLRTVIREVDSAIALDAVMTMDQRVGQSVSRPRTYAVLLAGFALAALLIAGAGLYGVLSHGVAQRSRELAVRSALGASRFAVVRVALSQVSMSMIGGVAAGIALALALVNQLSPFLYGVSETDWVSFAAGPLFLLIAGGLACLVPARRVAKTDPIQVLRESTSRLDVHRSTNLRQVSTIARSGPPRAWWRST